MLLFRFPRNVDLRRKWMAFCNLKSDPYNIKYVCDNHFLDSDFSISVENGNVKKRLKLLTVPSVLSSRQIPVTCENIIVSEGPTPTREMAVDEDKAAVENFPSNMVLGIKML